MQLTLFSLIRSMKLTKANKYIEETDEFHLIEKLSEQAVQKHKEGKVEEAISLYLELIRINRDQPAWVYANVITLYAQTKRLSEGLELGHTALKTHAQSDEVHRALGLAYENGEDHHKCIEYYQKAIELESNQPEWLYCNLAKKLLENNKTESAVDICTQGINLHKYFHYLYYVLGNALAEQEQWDKSIAAYRCAQEIDPDWQEITEKLNQTIYKKNLSEKHQKNFYQTPAPFIKRPLANPIEEQSSNSTVEIDKFSLNHINNIDADCLFSELLQQNIELSNCQELWHKHKGHCLTLNYGCWLSPSILYFEATVDKCWVLNRVEILVCSRSKYAIAQANFFQISDQQVAGIAYFKQDIYLESYGSYQVCIKFNQTLVLLKGAISQKSYGLEFIKYLSAKSRHQKHLIRENACKSIIDLVPENSKLEAKDFLNKIQYFLDIPASNYVDPNLPFKIFIDYIIPLKYDGLFISGWLQDPYQMLESITAISALGFSLELKSENIHRIERRDVNEFLQNTRYGNFEEELGFCAYAPVPDKIRQTIQGFARLHGFRFIVRLKGNIELEVVPDVKYSDYHNARRQVMKITRPDKVSERMLADCIAPTGLKLQQLCIEQVRIKDVTIIGNPVKEPLVSIIIPLYRRLDFMKVQLATLANDPEIKYCEIIYVLDSPEQEDELRNFLLNHCTLYQLPVKLVIMKRNSGYAAANNAGASQAIGKYLVLLNSDVFAKTKGWVIKMAEFYARTPKIGALGAKLLYEDGALQHAGMFFAQTTFPFWLTLHYYKGLPGNYAPAQKNRPVPAVTGACLMIDRKLYEEVGGLTTDYVIGDFEDSDLCLKCRALGYESWYFAEATLYHLERQSVPLNSVYNGGLAWRLNGRLHHKRWGATISKLMNIYQ